MGRGAKWGLVMLAVGSMLMPVSARGQFSPGKLSRAHAAVEGTTQCFKCHEPRRATTAARCLDCHRPLAARIAAGTGFHAKLDAKERQSCGRCHPEHGGETAKLIAWPGGRDAFDHRRTGWPLDGEHTKLRCNDCHKPDLVRDEDVRSSSSLALERTHLGLSTRCVECHRDPHAGQFDATVQKSDCAACHSTSGWKKLRFDHGVSRFPLDGKHTALACASCHPSQDPSGAKVASGTPGAVVRYRPLGLECTSCHTDPHQNRFGPSCRGCHSTGGWKQLRLTSFAHDRTRYPLTGRHTSLACEKCHWSKDAAGKKVAPTTSGATVHWKPIPFQACTSCHTDPHKARFGADCARCHSTSGWKTLVAGSFDHDQTRYPLRGRHQNLACDKCHRTSGQAVAFARCTDCHADAHRGQLLDRADGGACESCHDVGGFEPARFGPEEHAKSRFPLADAHRAVACLACHRRMDAIPGAAKPAATSGLRVTATSDVRLRFQDRSCAGCHQDPHAGQFTRDGNVDCARCHDAKSWRIARFDHDATRFRLDGAHARTRCAACHPTETKGGHGVVRYRPLDVACRACHADKVPTAGGSTQERK